MLRPFLSVMLLVLVLPATALADLRLGHVFQDNMVLQRDMKAPVWGWADSGAEVTVSFAGQTKKARAGDKGYWIVELDPLTTSAQGQLLTIAAGGGKLERKNILVGEVWVLSGQSNMARPLRNDSLDYPFFKDYYNDADYPRIRFMSFGMGASATPLHDVEPPARKTQAWKVLGKANAYEVMSIGFFFAKRINKDINVPVGLVQIAVSGTPQSAWMAKETLASFPGENGKADFYESLFAAAEANLARGKGSIKSWAEFEKALDAWRKDPAATERSWPGDAVITDFPSVLYNARTHPLAPLAFRGMLWHQGESGPGGAYGKRAVAMIKHHRALFKHDFHYIFGTLTRKTTVPPPVEPQVTAFGAINLSMVEGDQLFGEQGKAALVNFFDLGNPGTHWANKEEAGRRMALAALDRVYGQKHVFTGPQLIDGKLSGATVTCKFRHVGGGLKYEPSIDGISGVVISDKKGGHYWADVKITGNDTAVFSHPKVSDAAAVFYGSHTNPHETLFNAEGFPAFQFTVGSARPAKSADAAPLVSLISGGNPKTELHIAHVRRDGYVVSAMENKGPVGALVKVKFHVPAAWKTVEIRRGDKSAEPGKIITDGGKRVVEVDVAVNAGAVTLAEGGHSEALSKVRRP